MVKKTIPTFASIREEAEFWDTHDITDFLDELEVVTGRYRPQAGEKNAVMTIRMSPRLKEEVEKVAQSYDIPTSSLVRMWIVDRLRTMNRNDLI